MRSETLAGKAFFDVGVSEKLENVINVSLLVVGSLNLLCFVTFCCCHEDFGVLGEGAGRTDGPWSIKTSEL